MENAASDQIPRIADGLISASVNDLDAPGFLGSGHADNPGADAGFAICVSFCGRPW